jgi:ABC-type nitrate/sulfonate/bicarbonate transport system permease component
VPAVPHRIPAGVISTIVALIVWQIIGSVGPLAGDSFATATEAIAALWLLLGEPEFWIAVWQTLQMAFIGLLISVAIAVPLGFLIGLSRFSFRSTKFTFDFLKVIPPIVVIPIAILVIGPDVKMGIVLVVFANTFSVAIQTAYGVRDADPVLLETMRCYRMGLFQQIWYARLPSAAVQIGIALRIAISASLVVSVVAGLLGGAGGLGSLLALTQTSGNSDKTYAIVLFLGALGVAVSRLLVRGQRRVIFWSGK